jgi:hypothetical protein
MAVMGKHDIELMKLGWRIEMKLGHETWRPVNEPVWCSTGTYRAVRVERTAGKRMPLPWSTIKCGMVVRRIGSRRVASVDEIEGESAWAGRGGSAMFGLSDLTRMQYLDGDEWKPLYTEEPGEERIVEIISEEEI